MAYRVLVSFDVAGTIMVRDSVLTAHMEQLLGASTLQRYCRLSLLQEMAGPPAPDPRSVPYSEAPPPELRGEEGQAYAVVKDGAELFGQRWPKDQRLTPKQRTALVRRSVAMPGAARGESLLDRLVRDGVLVPVDGPCAHRAEQRFYRDWRTVPRRQDPESLRQPVAAVPPSALPPPSPPAAAADHVPAPKGNGEDPTAPKAAGATLIDRAEALLRERGEMRGEVLAEVLGANVLSVKNALARALKVGRIKRVAPGVYAAP